MDYNDLQLKAATDVEFRARLIADPKGVLTELGAEFPEGIGIKIEESTPQEIVLAIPPLIPEGVAVDEDALAEAAGGIISTPACLATAMVAIGTLISVPATTYSGYIVGKSIKQHFG